MGSAPVATNTNLEEIDRRRLEAGGPMGFIMAVHQTLKDNGRDYYYSGKVPDWLLAKASDEEEEAEPAGFEREYTRFREEQYQERKPKEVPHCVIHQWRKYPKDHASGTPSDSPSGNRRQKTPNKKFSHERPLPDQDPDYYEENRTELHPALEDTFDRPPLWDSKEQVPDLIRDEVEVDSTIRVTPWDYDVFVDFVLVAENMYMLYQMEQDFMMVLRTFHDRSATGASNLSGHFYQSVAGAPPEIDSRMPENVPTRTITWRLQQTESYAWPVQQLNKIRLSLYGDGATIYRTA